MSDWIGLAVIAFVVLCVVFGFSRLSKPYEISQEEFERRAEEGPGLLGAGLVGLQKALDPSMQRAAEVQEDLRQGRYDGEQESGDPPEAGQDGEAEPRRTSGGEAGTKDSNVINGETDA